jgi:ribosomal protein S25
MIVSKITRALSRTTDPTTSHEAAQTVPVQTAKNAALRCVEQYPFMTARELEKQAGVENGVIRKRLKSLERDGLINNVGTNTCSVTGRRAAVYVATSHKNK